MLQARPTSFLKMQLLLALVITVLIAVIVVACYFSPKQQTPETAVTVFSEPRELKPFLLGGASEKKQNTLFSQANFKNHWTFLFFGFTHCSEVCPATLTELNEAYQNLHALYPELQVVFISIDPEHEHGIELRRYAASFNKNFIGLSGTTEQLTNLKQQFGVIAERDETSSKSTLNHTSAIFLINPKGQWAALFPYGMRSKQIQTNFKTVIEKTPHV